jgi:hypothetical protein
MMSLWGCRYIQDEDPSGDLDFGGAGFEWYSPTPGDLKIRDTTNTTWNSVGNSDLTNLGNVPVTGATMEGALTGVTGWALADSPDFTTAAKLDGIDLATVNDLSTLQTTLEELIAAQIASGMAGLSASISLDNSVCWGFGSISSLAVIPLPSFSDRQATHSEIVLMLAAPKHTGGTGNITETECSVDSITRTVTVNISSGGVIVQGTANYVIVCKKASS